MAIIFLDTQILIWGIRAQAERGQEAQIFKAKRLLRDLDENKKDQVYISAVVMAELACGVSSSEQLSFCARLGEYFRIAPFDTSAAIEFSRIAAKLPKGKAWREALKADAMILATAIARKATTLYSEDDELLKIGGQFMDVQPMPVPPPEQGSLLES